MQPYFAPLVSFIVTILLTKFLLFNKTAKKIKDIPNERSLHKLPVPRIGGIALIIGLLSGWSILWSSVVWWILTPMMALFLVSIVDDIYSLSVRWRMLVHLGAALIFVVMSGLMVDSIVLGFILMLVLVWMTNLYNFMDGSDGLAGGMAVIGFAMYGLAAWFAGGIQMSMLSFSIAAATASFLYFNFYPAKIFMGDAGSIPLGFLAAAMGIWGWQSSFWSMWFPLLVFSPFILDATITLLKRMFRGENILEAHREHYYQRLLMLGAGHRNTALIEYLLMIAVGSSALWALQHPDAIVYVCVIVSVIYLSVILVVDAMWKNQCS